MGKYKKLYTVVGGRDIGVNIPFCVSTALVGRWMEEIHSSISISIQMFLWNMFDFTFFLYNFCFMG